jgi:hypothetical protein
VGVVIRGQVKDDRDQGPDVLNTSGLGVEVGDGGGLECFVSVREVEHLQWSHEVPLDGGKLALEGGHCSLLLLPHEGSLVCALNGAMATLFTVRAVTTAVVMDQRRPLEGGGVNESQSKFLKRT